jgi:hypothetical protein
MPRKEPSIETGDGMKVNAFFTAIFPRMTVAVAGVFALLGGIDAQAQTAAQPVAAEPGWYSYQPGRGWVPYTAPSAPAVTPGAPMTNVATTPVSRGWYGYSPATGWTYYAPASSPTYPNAAVTVRRQRILPADGSRRRAANQAVNHIAPELSYTVSAYREMGTGRPIPLAKPWLPPSP